MFNKYLSAKWTCKIICVNVFFSVKIQNEYVKYKRIVFKSAWTLKWLFYIVFTVILCLCKYKIVYYIFN